MAVNLTQLPIVQPVLNNFILTEYHIQKKLKNNTMKFILFLLSILLICTSQGFSQLKVLSDGSVEINSNAPDWGRAVQTKVNYQNSCAYHLTNNYYGGDVFYVRGDGYVWTRNGTLTASDSIFKTNIANINSPLSKIKSLRGVTYNRKYQISTIDSDSGIFSSGSNAKSKIELKLEPLEYGLIAQEVEKIVPEVVQNMHDGTKAIA